MNWTWKVTTFIAELSIVKHTSDGVSNSYVNCPQQIFHIPNYFSKFILKKILFSLWWSEQSSTGVFKIECKRLEFSLLITVTNILAKYFRSYDKCRCQILGFSLIESPSGRWRFIFFLWHCGSSCRTKHTPPRKRSKTTLLKLNQSLFQPAL